MVDLATAGAAGRTNDAVWSLVVVGAPSTTVAARTQHEMRNRKGCNDDVIVMMTPTII